jgi:hypothetical protein
MQVSWFHLLLTGISHLDLDKGASLGIMADYQTKGKAKRDDAAAVRDGVEERMARFEASTAKMQEKIGDLSIILRKFMDQAEVGGQTYASTLREAVETEF